ncbi:MAG: alanine--tRNA ligase [Candidatus Bipolaricaulis sp.]|nr:alanine--tRNA ligase [Candidatus Bipolaricaulis sp.]
MRSSELRRQYLEFFCERGHKLLPSSPLVPNDPTLLFTAAGMVQFKDYFWGRTKAPFARATTCQKCFRTTDIEEVGRTAYHHTFFEMLGNFSFGDYFKQGAIELAWEFLTREINIPAARFAITVYEEDEEAYAIWRDVIGIPTERILRLGRENNWWGPVGNTGPCGPDSELHYDTGKERACGPDCRGVACDCDRYAEIWNLVFMQYDAQEDGSFRPLDRKNIDTGMGLERATAILQGAPTNFDIDVFAPIVQAIEAAAPRSLSKADLPFRNTIADHMRGALFLVADGVLPGNEKQGYVLRRVLRRAIRAEEKLEIRPGSLPSFVDPVVESLSAVYPEITGARALARKLISREEETFRRTLRDGERRLEKILVGLGKSGGKTLPGELAFELTDTYGFPLEMTQEIAAESGVSVDLGGFEKALQGQRARSRGQVEVHTAMSADAEVTDAGKRPTEFVGYDTPSDPIEPRKTPWGVEATLSHVGDASEKGNCFVFEATPFYAASGGQVSDTGVIKNLARLGKARVVDVAKNPNGVLLHKVELLEGSFSQGDRCQLSIDVDRRRRIERNHTATHLLHAALRNVLGPHAQQAGSEVTDRELRFDFSHFEKMSPDEIRRVEDYANVAVLADHPVRTDEVTLEEARERGAIGLFEEEYRGREKVRLVQVGDVSQELCGGTHVRRSGEIGLVRIVSEEGIASGVRRIRAVTGDRVLALLRDQEAFAARMRAELGDDPEVGLSRLLEKVATLEARLEAQREAETNAKAEDLLASAVETGGVRTITGRVDLSAEQLKELADKIEDRARPAVVLLLGDAAGRAIVVCKVSKGIGGVNAGSIVRHLSKVLGGGGGGHAGFAQGGGPNVGKLDSALVEGRKLIGDATG